MNDLRDASSITWHKTDDEQNDAAMTMNNVPPSDRVMRRFLFMVVSLSVCWGHLSAGNEKEMNGRLTDEASRDQSSRQVEEKQEPPRTLIHDWQTPADVGVARTAFVLDQRFLDRPGRRILVGRSGQLE